MLWQAPEERFFSINIIVWTACFLDNGAPNESSRRGKKNVTTSNRNCKKKRPNEGHLVWATAQFENLPKFRELCQGNESTTTAMTERHHVRRPSGLATRGVTKDCPSHDSCQGSTTAKVENLLPGNPSRLANPSETTSRPHKNERRGSPENLSKACNETKKQQRNLKTFETTTTTASEVTARFEVNPDY